MSTSSCSRACIWMLGKLKIISRRCPFVNFGHENCNNLVYELYVRIEFPSAWTKPIEGLNIESNTISSAWTWSLIWHQRTNRILNALKGLTWHAKNYCNKSLHPCPKSYLRTTSWNMEKTSKLLLVLDWFWQLSVTTLKKFSKLMRSIIQVSSYSMHWARNPIGAELFKCRAYR